jgi:hypothetical protein
MELLSDSKLLELNSQGIVPGPTEDESDFQKRADYCLHLRENLSFLSETLPQLREAASDQVLEEALPTTRKFYDIAPTWIPLFFSNYKLSPWHGGCAWIFQKDDQSPTSAFFQLRQSFRTQQTYLGIYSRDELIAHELSHVGRMCFEEPQFEEFLAYRSSPSAFRRRFGPLIQSPWEGAAFLLSLFIMVVLDLSVWGHAEFYNATHWFKAIPAFMVVYAFGRLLNKHAAFRKCRDNLSALTTHPDAVIYRLTDREIHTFGQLDLETLKITMNDLKNSSLRWRLITLLSNRPS